MLFVKKSCLLALLFAFSPLFSGAVLATEKDAMTFVSNLADTFIEKTFKTDMPEKKKVENFREAFLKNCDIKFISNFVLGQAARKASAEEKENFRKVFSENVVLTWAGRFREYSGQVIEVKGTKPAQGGQIYVESEVVSPKSQQAPIALLWRLKKDDKGYKIVDLIIEGVSMTMSYRNEYTSLLKASGGDIKKLISSLDEKNKALAKSF